MNGKAGKVGYRPEGGRACIASYLHTAQQLADGRDPAPFHDRALDEDAVPQDTSAATGFPDDTPLKLVISLGKEPVHPGLPRCGSPVRAQSGLERRAHGEVCRVPSAAS